MYRLSLLYKADVAGDKTPEPESGRPLGLFSLGAIASIISFYQ